MKKYLLIGFILFSFFAVWTAGDPCGAEEKFPTKPITMLIGFAAGGGTDIPQRAMAEFASKILGQPIVVVNKPGTGGAVAAGELKNASPDGYTIMCITTGAVMSPHTLKVIYDPVNDFDAIISTTHPQYGLVVRPDSPFKSVKDLIDYAQANPNKIKYATAGAGTPQHLVMVQLADLLKIKWVHVPYAGGIEAASALMGGHVDCISQSAEWKPYVESGRLRLLATYGKKRMEDFPNAPTLVESGYNVTNLVYKGYIAPKGTPQERIKILHDAFYKGMFEDPEQRFVKANKQFSEVLVYQNSHDSQLAIKELYETSGKLIQLMKK